MSVTNMNTNTNAVDGLLAIADSYRKEHNLARGFVIINPDNVACAWSLTPNPRDFIPGCRAIGEGQVWFLVGGNDYDGAESMEKTP